MQAHLCDRILDCQHPRRHVPNSAAETSARQLTLYSRSSEFRIFLKLLNFTRHYGAFCAGYFLLWTYAASCGFRSFRFGAKRALLVANARW